MLSRPVQVESASMTALSGSSEAPARSASYPSTFCSIRMKEEERAQRGVDQQRDQIGAAELARGEKTKRQQGMPDAPLEQR